MPIPLYDDFGHHATQWVTPAQMAEHCAYLKARGFTGILLSFADPFSPNTPLRQSGVNGTTPLSDTSGSNFVLNPTYANYIRSLIDAADTEGINVLLQTYGCQNWIGTSGDNGVLRANNSTKAGEELATYFKSATNITHLIHGWDTDNNRSWENTIWGNVRNGWENVAPPAGDPIPGVSIDGGAAITGGEGGSTYTVTNLNNSGSGSLRDAVASGSRIVEFAVAGNIDLDSTLVISNSNITIRGETAPAPGICVRADDTNILAITGDNIIVQFLRLRMTGTRNGSGGDCVAFSGCENVALNHCSLSWATDELASFVADTNNVVIQWCMIYECLAGHSMGTLISGNVSSHTNIMYHHNLWSTFDERWPRLNSELPCTIDWRNNLTYNVYAHGNVDGPPSGVSKINYVNNKEIKGPNFNSGRTDSQDADSGVEVYSVGNVSPAGVSWLSGGVVVGSPTWSVPSVETDTVADMETLVKQYAGASYRLNGSTWVSARDSADTRIVNEVETNSGASSPPVDAFAVGGYPF